MTSQEVLQQCTVNGNIIKLPAVQLDRKLYEEVAKSLKLIGGKWTGGKVLGFVFQSDPTELLAQIASGEKKNLKKEFQFFETPAALADELVDLAAIKAGMSVLEPSAGQGAIVKAIHRTFPNIQVDVCEAMSVNNLILCKLPNIYFVSNNFFFLAENAIKKYDRIIANPPFSKNQDIDHIMGMYDLLAPKGRLVTISSKHWQLSSNKKETAFKTWLDNLDATVTEIEAGTFKESGTMVGSLIIIIDKK